MLISRAMLLIPAAWEPGRITRLMLIIREVLLLPWEQGRYLPGSYLPCLRLSLRLLCNYYLQQYKYLQKYNILYTHHLLHLLVPLQQVVPVQVV
jgi:hypothetical protein